MGNDIIATCLIFQNIVYNTVTIDWGSGEKASPLDKCFRSGFLVGLELQLRLFL